MLTLSEEAYSVKVSNLFIGVIHEIDAVAFIKQNILLQTIDSNEITCSRRKYLLMSVKFICTIDYYLTDFKIVSTVGMKIS